MGDDTLAKMEFPHKLVLAIALISCLAASMPADSLVAEEDHVPGAVFNQVRHLPANDIVDFLQKDESACRSVASSLKSEVNRLINVDQKAYTDLDTGVNCPNKLQSNTNTAQTAYNNAKAAVKGAEEAKTKADSAPVPMTVTFTKTPSASTFTSNPKWQKAVTTAKNAELDLAKKQGELKQAKTDLDTAKATQAKAVLACQCKAKKAFGAAVSNAKKHETSSKEDWRKSERLLCALKKQEPCPSNFPGFAKPPALPTAVSSKTKEQCRPPAPPLPCAKAAPYTHFSDQRTDPQHGDTCFKPGGPFKGGGDWRCPTGCTKVMYQPWCGQAGRLSTPCRVANAKPPAPAPTCKWNTQRRNSYHCYVPDGCINGGAKERQCHGDPAFKQLSIATETNSDGWKQNTNKAACQKLCCEAPNCVGFLYTSADGGIGKGEVCRFIKSMGATCGSPAPGSPWDRGAGRYELIRKA